MKKIIFAILLSPLLWGCSLPKSTIADWEGKIVYNLNAKKFSQNPNDSINYQIVFAKDSLLRIDSYTKIGKQIYLKNLSTQKAYVLMDLGFKKVALIVNKDTAKQKSDVSNYIFKRKLGKEKIGEYTFSNILVTDTILDTTMVMNYYPEISAKYATAFSNFPGLPAKYAIYSNGMWINYKIKEIIPQKVPFAQFKIPDDYEIMTFDVFMDMIESQRK